MKLVSDIYIFSVSCSKYSKTQIFKAEDFVLIGLVPLGVLTSKVIPDKVAKSSGKYSGTLCNFYLVEY